MPQTKKSLKMACTRKFIITITLHIIILMIIIIIKSPSLAADTNNNSKKYNVNIFNNKEEFENSLANYTSNLSQKFIQQKGIFNVAFSGEPLFDFLEELVKAPYLNSIEWSKWHVFWVDERVVPKNHPDSNYKLAFDQLLSKVPIPTKNIHAINDALPSSEDAAKDYESQLKQLVNNNIIPLSATGFPKFDLILLGVGPEGHVASLFPGHPQRCENQKWVTFINDSPKMPPRRITFTLPVINSASYNAFVVAGGGEVNAVKKVLSGGGQSGEPVPAQLVSAQEEVTWFLDKDAAVVLP